VSHAIHGIIEFYLLPDTIKWAYPI